MSSVASHPSLATATARRVDVHDDAQAAAVFAVLTASRTFDRPWDDHDGYEPTLLEWRYDDPAERHELWVVEDHGQVLGVSSLYFPLDDNTAKVWGGVYVDPDHRRRGVGTALMRQFEQRAREEGRPEVLVDAFVPRDAGGDHPYERFASAMGLVLESTDRCRELTLPVEDGVLATLEAAARPHWQDAYRLETYVDGLPEHLVAGYCAVHNLLGVDAPSGTVEFEEESLTPERYQAYLEIERRQGRPRLTTLAVHEESGEVVAYTDLVLPAGAPTKVWQWGTLVARAHRGHRLGMAVKLQNLRRLQQDHPERTVVSTGNDETNSYMVDINVALGFRVVELYRFYRKVLPLDA